GVVTYRAEIRATLCSQPVSARNPIQPIHRCGRCKLVRCRGAGLFSGSNVASRAVVQRASSSARTGASRWFADAGAVADMNRSR
ncbi:hypothetical protein, partial [Paraburkholderia sp. SIMBA_054]|uniref:hypothetical protein n=1 Tax=Paraburkholderia sp. SIMBA_054 TaxID=3085795 RepID=UPI00397903FB